MTKFDNTHPLHGQIVYFKNGIHEYYKNGEHVRTEYAENHPHHGQIIYHENESTALNSTMV